MAVAIGIWSLELTPGKIDIVEPEADLRITNVSFGDVLKDASGRTTVKFTYQVPANIHSDDDEDDEDQEVSQASKTAVLCSLKPGTFEQASTNIVLQEYEQYTFEVIGKNVVYLTGNYLDQAVNNPPFMDSGDEMESDDEEDAHDLRDISSDVEMNPDDLLSDASGLEELEEAPKLLKRPREQDTEPDAAKLSKSEKKKKQKGDNGKVIAKSVDEKKPEEKKDKETKNDKQESDSIPNKKANEIKKSKPVEREITGGVKVLDAKIGTGRMAKKGNTVGMRYIGKLQNGKVFDKNISGKPFTFHLGKGEVIKGWDEGIVGMQVGGERRLVISPEMAYGKKGMGDIPKHSTLIFEVKLVEIK